MPTMPMPDEDLVNVATGPVKGQLKRGVEESAALNRPLDGNTVWKIVDRPVLSQIEDEGYLPHGGNVTAPGIDERFAERRERWVTYVRQRLQAQGFARDTADVMARELWVAEFGDKPTWVERKPNVTRAVAATRLRLPSGETVSLTDGAPVGENVKRAAIRAKLTARMDRYRKAHNGRPMPEAMVRRMWADSGIAI